MRPDAHSGWLSGTVAIIRHFSYTLAVSCAFSSIVFNCAADSEPKLFLPFGTYLEHVFLDRIYVKDGFFYYGNGSSAVYKLGFFPSDGIPDPVSCWSQGYDLKAQSPGSLACDTSQQKPSRDAAISLHSTLAPYGSYLDSCIGTMRIEENSRSYLYSSCRDTVPRSYAPYPRTNKLDITDCTGGSISNEDGQLVCRQSTVYSRKILSGSYLRLCEITGTYYFEEAQRLDTICDGRPITQKVTNSCLGSGRDIIYQNGSLQCVDSAASNVKVHVASPYLPPGNYLLTCQKQAFYPCLGPDRKGRLVAECLNASREFVQAFLDDGDSPCRMDQLGYVANRNGVLVCDPSYEFNDENPTVGTNLMHTFQCNE